MKYWNGNRAEHIKLHIFSIMSRNINTRRFWFSKPCILFQISDMHTVTLRHLFIDLTFEIFSFFLATEWREWWKTAAIRDRQVGETRRYGGEWKETRQQGGQCVREKFVGRYLWILMGCCIQIHGVCMGIFSTIFKSLLSIFTSPPFFRISMWCTNLLL